MNISQITDYLYIGGQPKTADAAELEALGIRLIISMAGNRFPPKRLRQPPFQLLWLKTFDSFWTPIPIRKLFQGVRTALPVIERGERVLAHCSHGRHRGVAMGAAILIGMGHSAEEAMHLISTRRRIADPYTWYIKRRINKFERHWQAQLGD